MRILTRSELERVLLSSGWDMGLELSNPKVYYTILNKIQKLNNIKL
jgi:hypothetical protein